MKVPGSFVMAGKAAGVARLAPILFLAGTVTVAPAAAADGPAYLDPSQPIERRVDDLLAPHDARGEGRADEHALRLRGRPGRDRRRRRWRRAGVRRGALIEPGLGPGGGFFTLPNTILHEGPRQQAEFLNELQRDRRREDAAGHPAAPDRGGHARADVLRRDDLPRGPRAGQHLEPGPRRGGLRARPRARRARSACTRSSRWSSSRSATRASAATRRATARTRTSCSRIAETIVRAVQGDDVSAPDKVVAGLCHYPGQSQPVSGLERGAMEISERMLREVFLPPWEAGIRGAGALGVMATYPAIDGVPAHALGEDPDPDPARGAGLRGPRALARAAGSRTLVYEGAGADAEGGGRSSALRAGRRRGHLLRVGLHGRPRRQRARGRGAGGARRPRGAADPAPEVPARPLRASLVDPERAASDRPRPGAPGAGAARRRARASCC